MDSRADPRQLSTPKGGSQLDLHCRWQKSHDVQRRHIHVHSGPHNVQTVVEQRPRPQRGCDTCVWT
jgi:hypothetical protein